MTDDHWLSAMARYAGVERRRDRDFGASGGEYQLAQSLESKAKANPKRFVALTERMPASLPASNFDAILRGVAASAPPDTSSADGLTLSQIVALVGRVHALPGRPCGRWVTHSALVAGDLSKIVIRLYTQSEDEAIKTQCLNAIDEMEQAGFFGLADELGRVDR